MEDSISAMSIVPIKHPKELLDSIIEQVILDSKQEPLTCKYQVMSVAGLHTPCPTTSSCILHTKANIKIKSTGEGEEFHYEGSDRLRNLNDTAYAYYNLKDIIEGQFMLRLVEMEVSDGVSVFQSFQSLMRLHHIKVYRISDESGRGVYRVDFSPREHIGYGFHGFKFNGTAYFDGKSFRIKQIETDKIWPSSYDIGGKQDKKGQLSHTRCLHYRMDFEEVGGTLVVKQIEDIGYHDNQLTEKNMALRLS